MARNRKPRVLVSCVANRYAGPDERIVEFSFQAGGGGLISFRDQGDRLLVEVYRCDGPIEVRAPEANTPRPLTADERARLGGA